MTFTVAHVIYAFNSASGGPPRSVSLISDAAQGHWDVELFTTDSVGPHPDALLTSRFPGDVHLIPISGKGAYGDIVAASRMARALQAKWSTGDIPDVVHFHGLWHLFLFTFAAMARRYRVPYIVAPRGMLEPWSLSVRSTRKSFALRTYQGSVFAHATALHATSPSEAANIRRLPSLRAPVFVVPNPVEDPPSSTTGNPHSEPGQKVLLFLSRLHPKKGLDILLKAWNDVRPSNWRLWIVGAGDAGYVRQLQQYCKTECVPSVKFHPHVDGSVRESMFAAASALVLPTYSENFGNVVAEALIRGIPVITTTGTPWSVIATERLGWYIEPTAVHLQMALKELFAATPEDLRSMAARARCYARTNLSVSALHEPLLGMYKSVLDSAAASVPTTKSGARIHDLDPP